MRTHEKIKVVIADDNKEFLLQMGQAVGSQEDMEVIGSAADGEEALRLILELQPDIALLDVLMPLEDGFGILETLAGRPEVRTRCIMVSAINMDHVAKRCLLLGAKYYIVKPCRSSFLAEHIRRVYKQGAPAPVGRTENYTYTVDETAKNADAEEYSMEQRVTAILTKLNISPSIKGYYFLKNAINKVLEDESAIIGITKRMYPDIAKEYKTTASKVERAIRHAIESSWKKGGGKTYEELFGLNDLEKPTNGRFIASISEYIRLTTPVGK